MSSIAAQIDQPHWTDGADGEKTYRLIEARGCWDGDERSSSNWEGSLCWRKGGGGAGGGALLVEAGELGGRLAGGGPKRLRRGGSDHDCWCCVCAGGAYSLWGGGGPIEKTPMAVFTGGDGER
jgi:hypothetical protein